MAQGHHFSNTLYYQHALQIDSRYFIAVPMNDGSAHFSSKEAAHLHCIDEHRVLGWGPGTLFEIVVPRTAIMTSPVAPPHGICRCVFMPANRHCL